MHLRDNSLGLSDKGLQLLHSTDGFSWVYVCFFIYSSVNVAEYYRKTSTLILVIYGWGNSLLIIAVDLLSGNNMSWPKVVWFSLIGHYVLKAVPSLSSHFWFFPQEFAVLKLLQILIIPISLVQTSVCSFHDVRNFATLGLPDFSFSSWWRTLKFV